MDGVADSAVAINRPILQALEVGIETYYVLRSFLLRLSVVVIRSWYMGHLVGVRQRSFQVVDLGHVTEVRVGRLDAEWRRSTFNDHGGRQSVMIGIRLQYNII